MEKEEIRDDFIHVPPSEDKTIGNRLSRIAVECEISKDGGLDAFQETYVKKELITLIEREIEKAREETIEEVKRTLAKDTRYEFRFTEISELLSKLKNNK